MSHLVPIVVLFASLHFAASSNIVVTPDTAPLNVTVRIVGDQYSKPNESTTFEASVENAARSTTYLFQWYVDDKLIKVTDSKDDDGGVVTSGFRHDWPPNVVVGLHNLTTLVSEERNASRQAAKTIFVAVTHASIVFTSTSPTLPSCSTNVTMKTRNASTTFNNVHLIYKWSIAKSSGQWPTRSADYPAQAIFNVGDVGMHVFHADVIALLNGSYYTLTSGNTTIEISGTLFVSVSVWAEGYSDLRESVCSTCCALSGSVKFEAFVHDPTKCITSATYAWRFPEGFPASIPPTEDAIASSFYSETTRTSFRLRVSAHAGSTYNAGVNRSLCIEDPVRDLHILGPKVITKKQKFNITVYCTGSRPVAYCYKTCEKHTVKCTEYILGNATLSFRLEEPGECDINITARNNASRVDGTHTVKVQDTNDTPKTVSYTIPTVLGVIISAVLITFLVVFYRQYKAYRRRHVEVADFDYLGRKDQPTRWEQLKASVKSRVGLPTPASHQTGRGSMLMKRYGSTQQPL